MGIIEVRINGKKPIAPARPETRPGAQSGLDPWFNHHLGPRDRRAHEVISSVVPAVEQFGRKRALKSKDRHTFYSVLIPLTANLIQHYLNGSPGQGIPVPRSKRDEALGGKPNRYQPFSFPRSFPKMLDALCELGFAEQTIGKFSGWPGQSRRTTVRAGPKLIELIKQQHITLDDLSGSDAEEVIILSRPKRGHWDEGERVDYRDTETTHRFRSEVRALNAWLAKADITFDAAAHERPVNVRARRLRRHFTLRRFDRGGRLFGGFWQTLPKPARVHGIRIDGEHVVGLDYSQINPLLAYYVAEASPASGDAYTLPDLENYRDGVKQVFNAMLNHQLKKLPKGAREHFPRQIKFGDVSAAILQRHPKLKGVLSSAEIGHQLQFLESKIMMGVLDRCQKRNIVALPVFDCVVVKASAESAVREIMRREFKATTGLEVTVKRELPLLRSMQVKAAEEIDPGSGL